MTTKREIILKIFLSFLVIATTSLTFFHVKHSFYLYTLIIGGLFSFGILNGTQKLRLTFHLLTGFLWGSALLIFLSGLFALLGVQIKQWVLVLPAFLDLALIAMTHFDLHNLQMKLDLADALLLIFAGSSLFSHVVSIRGFWAPILHDPISHATWAKQIFDTGLIEYFYSPGLHILSALGMMVDGVNVATYILRLTNIFTALVFIPIYYFLLFQFKNKFTAFIGSGLFIIGSFPSALFLTAGKNALIVSFSIMALMLAILAIEFSQTKKVILIFVLLFTQILAHYPVAAMGFLLFTCFLVLNKRWYQFIPLTSAAIFGGLWGIKILPYFLIEAQNNIPVRSEPFALTISGIFTFLKSLFFESRMFLNTTKDYFIYDLGLLAIVCVLLLSFRNKRTRPFVLAFILTLIVATIINTNKTLFTSIFLIYETQLITFSFFTYIAIAICLGILIEFAHYKVSFRWIQRFTLFSVVALVAVASMKTYEDYRGRQISLNMVSGNDITAFTWIKENLENDVIILNNATVNSNLPYYVYGSDGGTWIPVFTDNKIAMPFTDFQNKNAHLIYDHYQNILNNSATCSDFESLISKNIFYYYQDSQGVFAAPLDGNQYPENLEPVYSEEGIEIYKINECQNSK